MRLDVSISFTHLCSLPTPHHHAYSTAIPLRPNFHSIISTTTLTHPPPFTYVRVYLVPKMSHPFRNSLRGSATSLRESHTRKNQTDHRQQHCRQLGDFSRCWHCHLPRYHLSLVFEVFQQVLFIFNLEERVLTRFCSTLLMHDVLYNEECW